MITKLGKSLTLLFDLEFYVPQKSRKESGLSYNPWDKSSRLLGGSFLELNGFAIEKTNPHAATKKIKHKWLWEHENNERLLLEEILALLIKVSDTVRQAHDNARSAILCGIGVTSSDVPVLFDLFKRYKLLSNSEAFELQNQFRILDLSQLAVLMFNHNNGFLYPVPKGTLMHKYVNGTTFESGTVVWELYEKRQYSGIEKRVEAEVISTLKCYQSLVQESQRLKASDKSCKNLQKLLDKERSEVSYV